MTGNGVLDVFVVLGIVAGGLGLFTLLGRGARRLWRLGLAMDDFLDDWQGAPARPGVAARPGVLERLGVIEHEVQTNGGGSLKDAVKSIEAKLDAHVKEQKEQKE